MHTYIALLRGINVNGQKMMSMEKLRTLLEDLGFTGVTTYIQSGNAVFQAGKSPHFVLEKKIQASILDVFGFSVPVMVKTTNEWSEVVKKNPFRNESILMSRSFIPLFFPICRISLWWMRFSRGSMAKTNASFPERQYIFSVRMGMARQNLRILFLRRKRASSRRRGIGKRY